jgi:DNA-binding MarR family transcriptional regulator
VYYRKVRLSLTPEQARALHALASLGYDTALVEGQQGGTFLNVADRALRLLRDARIQTDQSNFSKLIEKERERGFVCGDGVPR